MRHLLQLILALLALDVSAQITVTSTVYDDACANCTGCIHWNATGGSAPYTFLWTPSPPTGQGTPYACGLCAGSYSITVTDGNGDETTIPATVGSTTELLVPSSSSNAVGHSCDGACTGSWTL